MLKPFGRYVSVGLLNTAIHWAVFVLLTIYFHTTQTIANLSAFLVAVTFSFFVNSKWTFSSKATLSRYLFFVGFMGFLAVTTGWLAENLHIPVLFTLIFFSTISLFCGFIFSKYIVFRDFK